MALARTPNRRNSSEDPEEFRATLGEHLDELRSRILRVAGFFVVASTAGWFVAIPVYDILQGIAYKSIPKWLNYQEVFRTFTDPFMLQLRMAITLGIAVSLPFAVYEVWGFVKPGLKSNERKPVVALLPVSCLLFLLGCWVGWVMVPPTIIWFCSFFNSFKGSVLYQEPGTMVFLLIKLVVAFGIGFQLPIVTFALTKIGVISSSGLFRSWRHATVAIFVLSMILTPSGDPFTMLAMAVPLTILFFGSVLAVKLTTKSDRDDEDHALNNLD
ncbi:MAG: twin-arginine translocase subunit TatC [Armatimonadetes bacterium]|nr:twin-arginine translocase subunit TatC [Armatimonadota bacterium]